MKSRASGASGIAPSCKNLLVDGKRPGDVFEFQLTHIGEELKASVKYTVQGKERFLVCEIEAITFEGE
ncbi:MAG: hypothetical protein FWE19_00605 [Oscillospiraceae bacterium]|nr:hypothetical protein [Oscillospiraceae bacterium]